MNVVLRIELLELGHEVWRTAVVPAEITLDGLHRVVQASMGWQDRHLHQWRDDLHAWGPEPDEGDDDEREVRVGDVLSEEGSSLEYEYDFGDSWQHLVTAVGRDEGAARVELLDGAGACPPEDCGGWPGYDDLVASGAADPEAFDLAAAQRRVRRVSG